MRQIRNQTICRLEYCGLVYTYHVADRRNSAYSLPLALTSDQIVPVELFPTQVILDDLGRSTSDERVGDEFPTR